MYIGYLPGPRVFAAVPDSYRRSFGSLLLLLTSLINPEQVVIMETEWRPAPYSNKCFPLQWSRPPWLHSNMSARIALCCRYRSSKDSVRN